MNEFICCDYSRTLPHQIVIKFGAASDHRLNLGSKCRHSKRLCSRFFKLHLHPPSGGGGASVNHRRSPGVKFSSPHMRPWETSQTNQDYTFRDHFFSCWLEKCVSKEFGLAAHDEEFRCFLQSRKLVGRLCFFSTVEDCSEFLKEALMEETWSEWSLFCSVSKAKSYISTFGVFRHITNWVL